jgi:hypothetical protein
MKFSELLFITVLISVYGIINTAKADKEARKSRLFMCEITTPEHLSVKGQELCAELLAKKEMEN